MRSQLTLVSIATPLLAAGMWSAIPGHADSRKQVVLPPLPALPEINQPVEVAQAVMAPLPPVPPPLKLEPNEIATIQRGDSLASFLSRHNVTLEQLKTFNPGLEVADLTVGRVVRVAEAAPGQALLAIRPVTSGGAAWPNTPDYAPVRTHQTPTLSDSYMWPTKGVFTSGYGWRWGRMHKGIDIANNTGTPIHAARQGVVTYAGWSGAYGYLVEIAHSDGDSTRYAHNSRLLVNKGQVVARGMKISLMGSTGRSTGPHLHFEIRRSGGAAVNPLTKLPKRNA
ncbi:MAG: LysM peptidoglycan-binding domain-containing M23 family metallopeptidase [Synechococcus sp.]